LNESIIVEIYCKPEALQNAISEAELRLIESFLPELLALMAEEDTLTVD